MRTEKCEDKLEIDQDLTELPVEVLVDLLSLVRQCHDCRGCDGLEADLVAEIERRGVQMT
jgi:hypothetical protein